MRLKVCMQFEFRIEQKEMGMHQVENNSPAGRKIPVEFFNN
jgi:hypothetical protein